MAPTFREYLLARLRLVGRGFLFGAVMGVLAVVALFAYTGDVTFANRKSFAVGALFFGFALVGWAGSIMAGRGFENIQHYLDTNTNWTEADSRRAMATIGGAGFGWMVGVSVTTRIALALT